jgi:hypothetical protein
MWNRFLHWLLASSLAGVIGLWGASITWLIIISAAEDRFRLDDNIWIVTGTAAAVGGIIGGAIHAHMCRKTLRRAVWWMVGWALLGAGGWLVGGSAIAISTVLHDVVNASDNRLSLTMHSIVGHMLTVVVNKTIVGIVAGIVSAAFVELLVALFRDPEPED